MNNSEINNSLKHLSRNDKIMSSLIKKFGRCNLQPHGQYFNSLLRSIIGQQLSVKAADSIYRRFTEHFKGNPSAGKIQREDDLILRRIGLSNAKVKYVKDLALKVKEGIIDMDSLAKKGDEQIIEELTKVKGIGLWTVQMFLIFTLGRADILPVNDHGIRRSIMLNYGLKKLPDGKRIVQLAKKTGWHPYCSIASLYLWKSLDSKFETIME